MTSVIVDSNIWIQHLKGGLEPLKELLKDGLVLVHPFVRQELACGRLKGRDEFLSLLEDLPRATVGTDEEFYFFLNRHSLFEKGLGFVDIHLLMSARLMRAELWTRDKALNRAATGLRVDYTK